MVIGTGGLTCGLQTPDAQRHSRGCPVLWSSSWLGQSCAQDVGEEDFQEGFRKSRAIDMTFGTVIT